LDPTVPFIINDRPADRNAGHAFGASRLGRAVTSTGILGEASVGDTGAGNFDAPDMSDGSSRPSFQATCLTLMDGAYLFWMQPYLGPGHFETDGF